MFFYKRLMTLPTGVWSKKLVGAWNSDSSIFPSRRLDCHFLTPLPHPY